MWKKGLGPEIEAFEDVGGRIKSFEAAHFPRTQTRSASEEMSYSEQGIAARSASLALRVSISPVFYLLTE
jgi:hypothetical protein